MTTLVKSLTLFDVLKNGNFRLNPMIALATMPVLVILSLLSIVIWVSVTEDIAVTAFTLKHYVQLYSDPFAYEAFFNTIKFTLVTVFVALMIGFPAAWLVERTDVRGKTVVYTSMVLGLLIPGFFTAMGWVLLLHPRIGMVNEVARRIFDIEAPVVNILNIAGMGVIQGLSLAALAFIMLASALRAIDASLEEAAQMSGAGVLRRICRITLPLVFPSVLATALYVSTIALGAFDVPAIIGLANRIFTFSTFLYYQTYPYGGVPQYGLVASFSSFMILLALFFSWLYGRFLLQARKYQVISGKGYRRRPIQLGRWWVLAWFFLGSYIFLSKVIPLGTLIWTAALPYLQPPSIEALKLASFSNFFALPWSLVFRGLRNTFILAVGAPTVALVFSLILSWVVLRSHSRFRLLFDYVAFLPHAVPNIVFSVAALVVALFVMPRWIELHGSVVLLLGIYALVHLTFGTRMINNGLMQINVELEEAAYISGVRLLHVIKGVLIPLLKPGLINAWLWLFLLTCRELTLATYLSSAENITLPVVAWSLWDSGNMVQASAVTVWLIVFLLPLTALYWRLGHGRMSQ